MTAMGRKATRALWIGQSSKDRPEKRALIVDDALRILRKLEGCETVWIGHGRFAVSLVRGKAGKTKECQGDVIGTFRW